MNKLFFFIPILILLWNGSISAKKAETQNQKELSSLKSYYNSLSLIEANQYNQALVEIDSAISDRPEYVPLYFTKGHILEKLEKPRDAITAYETALNLKSFYPEVWIRLSDLYQLTGEYTKSAVYLQKLVNFEPDSLNYVLLLADAHLKSGNPNLAKSKIYSFLSQGGHSIETERILGLSAFLNKDYKNAIFQLEKYLTNVGKNFEVEKALGISYINSNLLDKGINYLDVALSLNPGDVEIYLYRARYFIERNKYTSANDQILYALNLDSNNVDLLFQKGKLDLLMSDSLSAERTFLKILELDSTCWENYKWLGEISEWKNDLAKSLAYFEKYLQNIYQRDLQVELRVDKIRKKINDSISN